MDVEIAHFKKKPWGQTAVVLSRPGFAVNHLCGLPGGFCSQHYHNSQWNHFHIIRGEICIRVWEPNGNPAKPDKRHLLRGQGVTIPPGVDHQFEVIQECDVVETCWANVDLDDIVRKHEGGMHVSQAETNPTD